MQAWTTGQVHALTTYNMQTLESGKEQHRLFVSNTMRKKSNKCTFQHQATLPAAAAIITPQQFLR